MSDNCFKKVTKEEAEYEIALALRSFLLEDGTPVYIRRDGWALCVSTSIAGPPRDRTKEFAEESWNALVEAVTTFVSVTRQSGYSTAMVIPDLCTWWVSMEPCH